MTSERNPEQAARLAKHWEDYLWFLDRWALRDRVALMHERRILGSGQTGSGGRADAARLAAELEEGR